MSDLGPVPGADPQDAALETCLRTARDKGFLGPTCVGGQIGHSLGLASAIAEPPSCVLDLGAGGGVPGLVLARLVWPGARWVLLESSIRRSSFLAEVVSSLGIDDRVCVVDARAEEAGRRPELRHRFDLVLARSFGPPGVTAECAAPFVRPGGVVLVSEPPDALVTQRWPEEGLRVLDLRLEASLAQPVHAVRSPQQRCVQ